MRLFFLYIVVLGVFLCGGCATVLQPTTARDRSAKARTYGTIIRQLNPECDNCSDRFVVQRADGSIITLVFKYNGKVEVYD